MAGELSAKQLSPDTSRTSKQSLRAVPFRTQRLMVGLEGAQDVTARPAFCCANGCASAHTPMRSWDPDRRDHAHRCLRDQKAYPDIVAGFANPQPLIPIVLVRQYSPARAVVGIATRMSARTAAATAINLRSDFFSFLPNDQGCSPITELDGIVYIFNLRIGFVHEIGVRSNRTSN